MLNFFKVGVYYAPTFLYVNYLYSENKHNSVTQYIIKKTHSRNNINIEKLNSSLNIKNIFIFNSKPPLIYLLNYIHKINFLFKILEKNNPFKATESLFKIIGNTKYPFKNEYYKTNIKHY